MKRQLSSAIEILVRGERHKSQGKLKIETVEAVPEKFAVSPEWRYLLLGSLESSSAPRVCTTKDLTRQVRQVRPRATLATVRSAIDGLVWAGALSKVSQGLYLNRRCRPITDLGEAAQHIRQGAVLSLESVLGECGFLNNLPAIVTAVVPLRPNHTPNVGEVKTSGGQVFRFSALPERFLPSTDEDKRLMLQAGRFCPAVKPEVAALHWLRLALSPRSPMRSPPQDVDFSALDVELLKELTWRWDLSGALDMWLNSVERMGEVQEPSEAVLRSPETRSADYQLGQEAKARIAAKRQKSPDTRTPAA